MTTLPLAGLADALGITCPADLVGAQAQGIAIDSRKLRPGELFVALAGTSLDGHAYLGAAKAQGMAAAIVSEAWAASSAARQWQGTPCWLAVPEPAAALTTIGRWARAQRSGPVVGVTGSNGKTTTKELLAAALAGRGPVHRTAGNFNNHYGVPITLAAWPPGAWAAVIEMGMSAPQEIASLAALARPDVGLVTCVAPAHLEHFASLAGIAAAKAELFAGLPEAGVVVLNADDAPLVAAADAVRGKRAVLRFGRAKGVDVQLVHARSELGPAGAPVLSLAVQVGGHQVAGRLPLLGAHNAMNAAGAVAAAWALGVSPSEALAGMAEVALPGARLRWVDLPARGASLIDDCYNANPGSVRASLEVLAELAGPRRSVAVLGDMLELGPTASQLHRAIGEAAARLGTKLLWAIGVHAGDLADGAKVAGGHARVFEDVASMQAAAAAELRSGDVWLVKGSRGMRLERIADALRTLGGA